MRKPSSSRILGTTKECSSNVLLVKKRFVGSNEEVIGRTMSSSSILRSVKKKEIFKKIDLYKFTYQGKNGS